MKNNKNFKGRVLCLFLAIIFCTGCGKKNADVVSIDTTEVNIGTLTTEQPVENLLELPRTKALSEYDYALCANGLDGAQGVYLLDNSAWKKDDFVIDLVAYNETEIIVLYNGGKIYRINVLEQEIIAEGDVQGEYYADSLRVGSDGSIVIASGYNDTVKILDEDLNIVKKIQLSTSNNSSPKVTEDNKELFYVDHEKLDLCHTYVDGDKTSTVNMDIFNEPINSLEIQAVFPDRKQVLFTIYEEYGDSFPYLYDYELGVEVACDYPSMYWMEYDDEHYVSQTTLESENQIVFGRIDEAPKNLFGFNNSQERFNSYSFLKANKLITFTDDAVENTENSRYEIRVYSMDGTLENHFDFQFAGSYAYLHHPEIMEELGCVVFIADGNDSQIYVADLVDECSVATESDNYLYSVDCVYGKDEAANAEVRKYADELEAKYGIDIDYGDNMELCTATDYEITPIHNVFSIKAALTILDEELSRYPDGMLAQLQKGYEQPLLIFLGGNIKGVDESSLSAAGGYANSTPDYLYLVVDITDGGFLRSTIHHELFHSIESSMGVNGWFIDYDKWMSFNPSGFEYTWDYTTYEELDSDYIAAAWSTTEDKTEICFIDTYSKCNCVEDHARIMEYAMCEADAPTGYFEYDNIRAKLAYESEIIRQAFDTTGWPAVTEWEKFTTK